MHLVINIVDIVPEDMLCFTMLHLGASWYVARMSDQCEIFAVIEETSVVFIVWRNNRVVRFMREPIGDSTSQCVCIKCDYKFFIEKIAFDGYFNIENCENLMNHMLEHHDEYY